jgi:hypothetical protein
LFPVTLVGFAALEPAEFVIVWIEQDAGDAFEETTSRA